MKMALTFSIIDFHPPAVMIVLNDRLSAEKSPKRCQRIGEGGCQKQWSGDWRMETEAHTRGEQIIVSLLLVCLLSLVYLYAG